MFNNRVQLLNKHCEGIGPNSYINQLGVRKYRGTNMLMITENVKGKCYKQLINLLSKYCNRFAFVEDRRMMDIDRFIRMDRM